MNIVKKVWFLFGSGGGSTPTPLTGTPDHAYSMWKINPLYSGSAFRVRRSSDSTEQDIGFLSNYKADLASLAAFIGVSTGTITVIYDQYGGLNMTPDATFLEAIVYNDNYQDNAIISFERATAVSMSAATSINSRNYTIYTIKRGAKDAPSASNRFWEAVWRLGGSSNNDPLYYHSLANTRVIFDNGSNRSFAPLEITDTSDFNVHSLRGNATNVRLNIDNFASGTATPHTNATLTGFSVGRASNSVEFNSKYDCLGWIIYKSVLSDVDDTANVDALLSRLNKTVAYTKIVIALGDSIIGSRMPENARNCNTGQTFQVKLKRNYSDVTRVVAAGVAGQTVAQVNARITSDVINVGNFKSYSKKICIYGPGSNDIQAGTSAATILTAMQSAASTLKAAGWTVLVATVIPRATYTGPMETVRNTLNASIRTNSGSWHDGLVDYDLAGLVYATDYATSENPNWIHPNPAGYDKMVPIAKTALDLVL